VKKVYSSAFKAQVALELLKEEKSLSQLSSEHGVHASVLREWKVTALRGMSSLFERRDNLAEQTAAHTKQVEELYAEIGRLTTQVNWLKKTSPVACAIPPGEKRLCSPLAARGARSYNWLRYSKNKTYQLTGVRSTSV
jgi:transposase-like protein